MIIERIDKEIDYYRNDGWFTKPMSYILISKDLIWELAKEMVNIFTLTHTYGVYLKNQTDFYFDIMNSDTNLYKRIPILVIENTKNFIKVV